MRQKIVSALVVLPAVILCSLLISGLVHYHPFSWRQIYDHLEIIGGSGILGLAVLLWSSPAISSSRRPFTWVPLDGRWWEYLVFGCTTAVLWLVSMAVFFCAAIVIPVLLPARILLSYVLGEGATLTSALIGFPLILAMTSVAFAAIYLALMQQGKGNLVRNQQPLFKGERGEVWPIAEIYYFSLSTMLKGPPLYEASGWCRWVALAEVAVSRLMEIAIVTVGIGAILKRAVPAAAPLIVK